MSATLILTDPDGDKLEASLSDNRYSDFRITWSGSPDCEQLSTRIVVLSLDDAETLADWLLSQAAKQRLKEAEEREGEE